MKRKKIISLAVGTVMALSSFCSAFAGYELKEPSFIENFNLKAPAEHNAVGFSDAAAGSFGTYSQARYATAYKTEKNGNTYLKLSDISNAAGTETHMGAYGAFVNLSDTAVTGENIMFEAKFKIPKKTGDQPVEFRFRTKNAAPESASYAESYIIGILAVENNKYIYREIYDAATTGKSIAGETEIADYNQQWIALRWYIDTVHNSYKLYCNGNLVKEVANASHYSIDSYSEGANIKYMQARFYGAREDRESELYIDDVVFDSDTTDTSAVFGYGDVTAPVINAVKGEDVSYIINTDLTDESGNKLGKQLGVIVPGIRSDCPGFYSEELIGTDGKLAEYTVLGRSEVNNYDFENYEVSNGNNSVIDSAEMGSRAFSFGKSFSQNGRNAENFALAVGNSEKFEISFDMYWTAPDARLYFYNQVNPNNPACQILWDIRAGGETYVKFNGQWLAYFHPVPGKKINVKYIVDRTDIDNASLTVLIDGEAYNLGASNTASAAADSGDDSKGIGDAITVLRMYGYAFGSDEQMPDIYIDNLKTVVYPAVTSVDAAAAETEISVVKGRKPLLPKYAESILSDGSKDRLFIKWNDIETDELGTKPATGTVTGFKNGDEPVTVSAIVNIIEYPYELSLGDGNVTVKKLTDYAPGACLYIAEYDEKGILTNVISDNEIIANANWESADSVSKELSESANKKVFLFFENSIKPLSISVGSGK